MSEKDSMDRKTEVLTGWSFQVEERSAGVFQVTGEDDVGRSVQVTGTDPDALLEKCKRDAASMIRSRQELRSTETARVEGTAARRTSS